MSSVRSTEREVSQKDKEKDEEKKIKLDKNERTDRKIIKNKYK